MGNKLNDFEDFEFEGFEEDFELDLEDDKEDSNESIDSEFIEKRNAIMDKGTKRKVIRNSIIGIVCAIILLVVVGLIVGAVTKRDTKDKEENLEFEKDSWILIKEQDIIFSENYVESKFTITNINHYAKRIDSESVQLVSKLKGNIEGFTGEYEIELPYTKGSKLDIGTAFIVKIKLSNENGVSFIGEIDV